MTTDEASAFGTWQESSWRENDVAIAEGKGPQMMCVCGHDVDEHGGDDEFPNATECNVDECDCFQFDGE